MARLARVPARVRTNARFSYFSYFKDVSLPEPHRTLMWWTDPEMATLSPNEEGVTLAMVYIDKRRLEEFRRDPDSAVRSHFRGLVDVPDLDSACQVAKWMGKIDMPNAIRPAAARGMAFIGDAAQASDPIYGVGCGWAFQSAAACSPEPPRQRLLWHWDKANQRLLYSPAT